LVYNKPTWRHIPEDGILYNKSVGQKTLNGMIIFKASCIWEENIKIYEINRKIGYGFNSYCPV
jgi:hypothetical protein